MRVETCSLLQLTNVDVFDVLFIAFSDNCASTVAAKDVRTYNVVAVFKDVCGYVSAADVKDVFV